MSDQFTPDPEEELPDWLKALRARGDTEPGEDPPAEPPESAGQAEEDLAASPQPEGDATPPSEAADNAEDDEPDWLKDIRRRHEADKLAAAEAPPEPEEDAFSADWASPASDETTTTPILEVPAEPVEPQEALEELEEESEEELEAQFADPQELEPLAAPDEEEPLSDDTQPLVLEPSAEDLPPVSDEPEDFDEEEREDDLAATHPSALELPPDEGEEGLEEAAPLEEVAPAESSDGEEQTLDGLAEEAEGEVPRQPEDSPADSGEEDELLSWLSQTQEGEQEEQAPVGATPFSDPEEVEIEPGELPAWLQALKPGSSDAATEGQTSGSPIEEFERESDPISDPDQESLGPLAGLSGVLPAEPEIMQAGRAKIPTGQLEFTPNQKQHVATLENLLAQEGAPLEDFQKRIALPMRLLQLLFAALLFIATLFPLLTGSQLAARPPIGSFPESNAFFNQVELLPPNVPVLVAFEVQPALYSEMQAIAGTVIQHLLDKQAYLVFISTQPTGPALAERLLSEQFSDQPSIATGNYTNLGYLSGGTAALRYFAASPRDATLLPALWETPALENIESIANFGVVLLITGDAEDARAWIEQVSPTTSDGLFTVSSAQATPLLLPYLETNPATVRSLVGGLNGAAYYESLRNRDGLGRNYWDAYSFGLGAIVVLILLGGLYGRLLQMRPEAAPPTKEDGDGAK